MKPTVPHHDRRRFLSTLASVGAGLMMSPLARAATRQPGELKLYHLHTGERLTVTYADDVGYLRDGLSEINRFLRDFRTGEIYPIEPALLDILNTSRLELSQNGTFEIISGYRSPQTNAALRARGRGVAKRSFHMQGRALDIRLSGVTTATLRQFYVALRQGGVGYYEKSNFVHIDTGRFRTW